MPLDLGRRIKAGWQSLGINTKMVCVMFKGSVPVAISLGIYQSTAVSEVYTSLGFLVSIIAVVTVNILPRAKLIQMTFTICLFAAIAIPVTMLATWSGLQARFHTDPHGLNKYNSSQSAIAGVWLFVNILISNSLQARYPELLIPTILYNIFIIVQFTSCSRFDTWKQCWDLIYLTIRCYYTGVAISFVSGILVYPVTCRSEIFEVQEKYIEALRDMLDGVSTYLGGLLATPAITPADTENSIEGEKGHLECDGPALRAKMVLVKSLYIKMHHELAMAKREIAWGKLRAKDITAISDHCRRILMPLGGMANVPDILRRIAEDGGWVRHEVVSDSDDKDQNPELKRTYGQEEYEIIWQNCVAALVESATVTLEAIKDGLEHAALQLEIIPRPGTKYYFWLPGVKRTDKTDLEAEGEVIKPGNPQFSKLLRDNLAEFSTRRVEALTAWADCKGLSAAQVEKLESMGDFDINEDPVDGHVRFLKDRRQLYLILYIQYMIYTTGVAVLELCKFSDTIVAEGILSRNRLIVPSLRRLRKWFVSMWDTREAALADDDRPNSRKEAKLLYAVSKRNTRNIDHLPPRNAYERFGIHIRRFQEFLKGPEFSFGFRSACATMSCAIIAYLHQTQEIFTHYRLIWSVIIAAIGANMSAGQSGVSYVLRILGSFAALIICYAVWYIPDGKVPGVIVIMWFASFLQMYFIIRWPQYIIGWLVVLITEVLSIGYELQVSKIGMVAAESTGQHVFPPYSVAAMRVACVLWGTCVSIFFTYFPYPITARGILRRDMATIMQLLANYHAVVHSTIKTRLRGAEGDASDKQSRGRVLSHMRKAMFNKIMLYNSSVSHNVYLQKYEPTLGGRFPVAEFKDISTQLTVLLDYISLLSYATQAWSVDNLSTHYFPTSPTSSSSSPSWQNDLSRLLALAPLTSTPSALLSLLTHLSYSISTGRPLPPAHSTLTPPPYALSARLRQLDPEILHVRHVLEYGYSALA
ncbi:Uncharacterized protein LARI1_G008845, partial [Lachnellula arida]